MKIIKVRIDIRKTEPVDDTIIRIMREIASRRPPGGWVRA